MSVCVFVWLLFFSHVLNSFTVANSQRPDEGRSGRARNASKCRSEHCQRACGGGERLYLLHVFCILFFSDQHTLWSRCSFTDAKSAMVRRDDSNSSGVRAGPLFLGRRRSAQRTSLRCMVAALPSPSTKRRFVTACVCMCRDYTIIKHN